MSRRGRGEGRVYQPSYRDTVTREKMKSAVWWIQYSRDGDKIRESSKSEKRSVAVDLLREP